MLRRAAPIIRSLRSAATVAQSGSAGGRNEEQRVVRVSRGEGGGQWKKRDGVQGRDGREYRNPRRPYVNDEHSQLLKRHGNTIENTEVESLSDAVERINWYSTVSGGTLEKVAAMMQRATIQELNSSSDRSMATLFSSFGETCMEKKREEKNKLMQETKEAISKKGYSFGPLARTAIFTARVDNARMKEELPLIVDELSVWDHDEVATTEEMLVQAARVYALQGDRKGVIELTNFARESFSRVDSRFVDWLAFSMMTSGGEKGNGVEGVEKLASRSSADTASRLWLNAALAAAGKADLETTLTCLSRVSHSSNFSHSDQNGPLVDILIKLIEEGVQGAEHAMTPHLALSSDGTSLHEKHAWNSFAILKARRACREGKIEAAIRLYALSHETTRNIKPIEFELRKGLGERAAKGEGSVEEMRRCASRLHQAGLIEDTNAFLLSGFRGERMREFVDHLRKSDELAAAVEKCRVNKFVLATTIIKDASYSPSLGLAQVTAILHCEGTKEAGKNRDDMHRIVFKAANADPDEVVKVLELLAESSMADAESIASHIVSSAMNRLLRENDVLTSGRVHKILASPNVPTLRLFPLEGRLIEIIRREGREEKTRETATQFVADIVTAAFKTPGRKEFESAALLKLVSHTGITDDHVEMLVNKLCLSPSVGIGREEMERGKEALEKRGLTRRAQIITVLKKKSQTSQRWLVSPVEDLEKELISLEKAENVKEEVLSSLRGILMDKLVVDSTLPSSRLVDLLEKMIPSLDGEKAKKGEEKAKGDKEPWKKSRLTRMRESSEKVYGKAMRMCAIEGDWSAARRLWAARGGLRTLPVSSSLALSFHEWREGEKEKSNEILSVLRSTGQSVGSSALTELGDLWRDFSTADLSAASEWLKKELRLESSTIASIEKSRSKKAMGELIASGRLEEAFNVMKEISEKSNSAVAHFAVLRAAIKEENRSILESTVNLVSSLHSKPTAILDLAFSFLLENRLEYAAKLIKNPMLKLSHSKLGVYTKAALEDQRTDVLRSLFTILVSCPLSDEKVSNSDLNYLALSTLRAYLSGGEGASSATTEFIQEIEASSLLIEKPLKEFIERSKKFSPRSSSV